MVLRISAVVCAALVILSGATHAGYHVGILGDRTGEADSAVFTRVVAEIQRLHPDIVINVGDLIEGPQPDDTAMNREWDQVKKELSPLTMPLYIIPGNNDIFCDVSERVYSERTGRKPYYSFDYETTHFVVLDNSRIYRVDQMEDEQLKWLARDLTDHADAALTCVFMHKPFWVESFSRNEPDRLHDIFSSHGVDWVFSGHYHSYVTTEKDGIRYVMVGSSGGHIGSNPYRGEYYQFGWFWIDGSDAEFSLVSADAVRSRTWRSLSDRTWQNAADESVTLTPVLLPENDDQQASFMLQVAAVDDATPLDGTFEWHTAGTPWSIAPGSGRYGAGSPASVPMTALLSGASIFPLPRITVTYSLPGSVPYAMEQRPAIQRRLTIPVTANAPVPDGDMNDSCWQDAAVITDFGSWDGGIRDTDPVSVRMIRHGQSLNFYVECTEEQMDQLIVSGSERDGPVFGGDCMYLMFWIPGDAPVYCNLVINPDGVVMDARADMTGYTGGRPRLDMTWNPAITVMPLRTADTWRLELILPLSELGIATDHLPEIIFMNLARFQARRDAMAVWHWPAAYDMKYAGRLRFAP